MSRKYIVEKNNFDAHVGNKSNPHGVTATQIGAATPSDVANSVNAHANNKSNPHGVTADQIGALKYLGENPTQQVANDTTQFWSSLGSGFAWISAQNQVNNQPSAYMFITSYKYGSDIFQLGKIQNSGKMFYRSGNASGWGENWTEVANSNDVQSVRNDLNWAVNNHANNKDNPHGVTAAQVGAATIADVDWRVNNHANNRSNPHGVTADQVGLSDGQIAAKVQNLMNGGSISVGTLGSSRGIAHDYIAWAEEVSGTGRGKVYVRVTRGWASVVHIDNKDLGGLPAAGFPFEFEFKNSFLVKGTEPGSGTTTSVCEVMVVYYD